MPRPRGRPSKLTPETTQKLVEQLEEGYTRVVACSVAGIDYRSFPEWLRKGEEAIDGEYYDFYTMVRAAELVAQHKMEERHYRETRV